MPSSSRVAPAVALLIALALGVASDRLRASSHERYVSGQRYEDVYYLPPPDWLRVMSLGWDEAAADLVWIRALVYFGEEYREGGRIAYVFDYAEAMVTLDPHFRAAYRWVGMAGLYRPQAVELEEFERAVAFMQRGARLFPEDGQLAWDIGAALVFELAPLIEDQEVANRARERGIPYLMSAVRLGAAPEWAALSNASLLARIGRGEQAARHLEDMYLSVEDPALRARIAERIEELRSRAEAEAALAAARELDEARARAFPYLGISAFLLVGERPPVDLVTPIREGLPHALAQDEAEGTPDRAAAP